MIALHLTTFSFNLEFIWKSEKWSLIITCPVTAAAQKVAFLCTWEGNQAAAFWCNSCWSCLFPPFQFPAVFLPQHLWNACSHSGVCNHRLEPFPDAFGHFCHNAGSHPLEQLWRNQFLIFFFLFLGEICPALFRPAAACLCSPLKFCPISFLPCFGVHKCDLDSPSPRNLWAFSPPSLGWDPTRVQPGANVRWVDSLMPCGRHITFRLMVTQWCYRIRWHFTAQVIKIDWACSIWRKRCRRTDTGTVLV